MQRRSYLLTGMLVGSSLGAVASPLVSEAPGRVGFTADTEDVVDVGVTVDAPGPAPPSGDPAVLDGHGIAPAEPSDATATTPVDTAATSTPEPSADPSTPATTTLEPAPSTAPPAPTASTADPTASTTTTVAGSAAEPTLCAQLTTEGAAKLVVDAALRAGLDRVSDQPYAVVVTLIAPQSTRPEEEQRLRLGSVAAFAEIAVEEFIETSDGRWAATMTNSQLCRVLYLRPVTQVEVRPPATASAGGTSAARPSSTP